MLLVAILHFVPDADEPADIIATFRDAMAPGSYLIVSHATMDGAPPHEASRTGDAQDVYQQSSAPLIMRDPSQVGRLLDGFSLVEPDSCTSRLAAGIASPPCFHAFLGAVGFRG